MEENCRSPEVGQPALSFTVKGNQQHKAKHNHVDWPALFQVADVRTLNPLKCPTAAWEESRDSEVFLTSLGSFSAQTRCIQRSDIRDEGCTCVIHPNTSGRPQEMLLKSEPSLEIGSPLNIPPLSNCFEWLPLICQVDLQLRLTSSYCASFHKNRSFCSETFLSFSSFQPSDTPDRQSILLWQDAHLVNVS